VATLAAMRRLGPLLVVAVLAAGCVATARGGSSSSASPPHFRGTDLGGTQAPPFALRDDRGRSVTLASLRGDYVLVTFLYTHCPDVCPLIATNLGLVLRRLPVGVRNVRAVAVSVDPKGDTPRSVRHFLTVHRLPRTFLFLIGSRPQLRSVWAAYHIAAAKGPEQTVNHSAYTMLLDPRGRERVLYDAQVHPADVLHDLRVLASAR
jgi:protein SCO1